MRSDKLTQHIRDVHDAALAACPHECCVKQALSSDFLAIHIRQAHEEKNQDFLRIWTEKDYVARYGEAAWQQQLQTRNHLKAIINGGNTKYRKCPLWSCKEKLDLATLMPHLLDHAGAHLDAMEAELSSEGYLIARNGTTVIGVSIACPVLLCGALSSDHAAFAEHLTDHHLLTQGAHAIDHYHQWQEHVRANVSPLGPKWREYTAWQAWPCCSWKPNTLKTCPNCGEEVEAFRHGCPNKHHLGLLRDEQEVTTELYPVRGQILRLYPAFASHPVFDDLK